MRETQRDTERETDTERQTQRERDRERGTERLVNLDTLPHHETPPASNSDLTNEALSSLKPHFKNSFILLTSEMTGVLFVLETGGSLLVTSINLQ